MNYQTEAGKPTQISASKIVRTGKGILLGIFCGTVHSSSTLAFSDGVTSAASAGGGRFISPFTPSTGFTYMRMTFDNGLYASLAGSAQDITAVVMPA